VGKSHPSNTIPDNSGHCKKRRGCEKRWREPKMVNEKEVTATRPQMEWGGAKLEGRFVEEKKGGPGWKRGGILAQGQKE